MAVLTATAVKQMTDLYVPDLDSGVSVDELVPLFQFSGSQPRLSILEDPVRGSADTNGPFAPRYAKICYASHAEGERSGPSASPIEVLIRIAKP